MGPNSSLAFLVLWGLWASPPLAKASVPPDLSMAQASQMFLDFMLRFNKSYQTQEEMDSRFKIFTRNLQLSRELQATELGTAQYGVTQFSDLTESEFAQMFGMGPARLPLLPPTLRTSDKTFPEKARNTSCDWRKAGAVTAVKNQKNCRACWAFAAVANIEALWNIHRREMRNVSVQELVDCTYNRNGCDGGYPWDGFVAVVNRSGLSSSRLYPYTGVSQQCRKHRRRTLTPIDGYELLPRDEQYIANTVATRGPVTALLNSGSLQNYQKGNIWNPRACSITHLDHVGTIVGFGQEPVAAAKPQRGPRREPYWIIQNAWGKKWGEEGYFRLKRGTNACGIAMYAATAVVRNSGKKKPLACPPE